MNNYCGKICDGFPSISSEQDLLLLRLLLLALLDDDDDDADDVATKSEDCLATSRKEPTLDIVAPLMELHGGHPHV